MATDGLIEMNSYIHSRGHEILRLAYRLVDGEWQELWACRGEVQAGTPECSLRGTESSPTGGDRGSDCGLARAVKCRPSSFPMQAATHSVAVPALYHQSRA